MIVLRTDEYWAALQVIQDHIAQSNPMAAIGMWLHIDDQVAALADPNFPRRPGRVPGTMELVAHANYIVLLKQSATEVIAFDVVHAAMQFP